MDSFAQKTADLPLQRKEDVPSLRKAHQDVMQMSFLPEEIKTRFVAASISDSVGSPQAKELKSFVDNTKMFVPRQDEQYSLIGAAVSYYWNQKTPENRMVAADARPENTQNTPTSDRADGLLYTQSNDEYCKAGDGDTSQKRRKSTHGARETCHSNVAEALDHLGPAIPPSWYIRQYKCYDKACQCDMLVWSPNRDLSSGPAYVLIDDYSKHEDHDPIDWMAWYSYKEGTRRCGGQWDSDKYPKKPGLPFSVLMAVDDVMRVSPNIGPSQAATMVSNRFNYHPLFMNVGPTVDILRKQIMSLVRFRKKANQTSRKSAPTVTRIQYSGDIKEYITLHRINYERLKEIHWKPIRWREVGWIRTMASILRDSGVLCGLGFYEKLPERDLIVLDSDEVTENGRWRYLHESREGVHTTGLGTRGGTVVFSSIALLANAIWCEEMKWEVCANVDGTHGISNSSYKLITLGVNGFSDSTLSRTFHPLVYILGEGERETVALHGFLNLKVALHSLFGIENVCFKGGIVSDATPMFPNSVKTAFPSTPLLSCYPHIIRKFKMDGRSGNGLYAAKLKTQKPQWLTDEAEPAVKRLARCKTVKQKEKMWHLTKEQWEIDGEGAMAATFAKTYIDNPDFANWHYTASGKHGCVPCNNPMERHNLAIKGSANFFGYIETGKTLFQCLTKEFVVLVYQASTDLSYPSSGLPVVNYEKAFKNDQFMEFQSLLDPNVDIKEYGGGWLVNELTYLALPITEEDVEKMEMALEGKVEENTCMENENKDIRDVLLSRTARFHHVRKSVWTGTNPPIEYFHCDCREYYFKRWCFQSAYMQHREKLSLLGNKIPAKKKCNSKSASSHMAVTNALRAAKERIRVKKRNKTDQPETI
ncbi:hypothetical protein IV203_032524 [Nitzschia inconspicua]|uniref:Uncharacterized protein n=1 Tax=Nitzschia inconspicua TaxID=303405 RepID=A0A9K3KJS6_9STRA|nr:hypothetical protein IV203_032524 [Nitzschia inconspicua]